MREKIRALSAESDKYFLCGAVDHSPQELVKEGAIHTAVFIFYNTSFHKKFTALNIQLKKWSKNRGGAYQEKFINEYWPKMQGLPFFAHVMSLSGDNILQSEQFYLEELKLDQAIERIQDEECIYHRYNVFGVGGQPKNFKVKVKLSLSALYISHFIIRVFMGFKKFCMQHNIPIIDNPFQVYHDRLPLDDSSMGNVISSLVSCSQYVGYPACVISLMHWGAKGQKHVELPDELLADNLAGLFKDIAAEKYDKNKILGSVNKSILIYESSA